MKELLFLELYTFITIGLQKKRNNLKYAALGQEPVSIILYTRPGSSIKQPTQN